MDGNIEMLNYIYQNAEMGVETIKQLIEVTRNLSNEEFKSILNSQYNEYKRILNEADNLIRVREKDPKELNSLAKISTYIVINIKTLINKNPDHIAEMIIQGSTMGIVDVTKRLNNYTDADKDIIKLANDLLMIEKGNQEEFKKFL